MDSLSHILEIAGISTTEKKDLYIFVAGDHGSGKTNLVQDLSKDISKPATSTFGYEISSFSYQGHSVVNVIEVTETSPENKVLANLATKNIENSIALFIFDMRHPNNVENIIKKYVEPFFGKTICYCDTKKQEELAKYYSTIVSESPIIPAQGVMTKSTFIPTFFIVSFDDELQAIDDKKFAGYMYKIRNAALEYGAGILLRHSKCMLQVLMSTLMREPIPNVLWDKICNREDFFIPPSWDSSEKINSVEREEIQEEKEEEKVIAKAKVSQNWKEFLENLSKQKREVSTTSPAKAAEEKESKPEAEKDFLSMFE